MSSTTDRMTGVCSWIGCARPAQPAGATGRPPEYCSDPDHERRKAYRERKKMMEKQGARGRALEEAASAAPQADHKDRLANALAGLQSVMEDVAAASAAGHEREKSLRESERARLKAERQCREWKQEYVRSRMREDEALGALASTEVALADALREVARLSKKAEKFRRQRNNARAAAAGSFSSPSGGEASASPDHLTRERDHSSDDVQEAQGTAEVERRPAARKRTADGEVETDRGAAGVRTGEPDLGVRLMALERARADRLERELLEVRRYARLADEGRLLAERRLDAARKRLSTSA